MSRELHIVGFQVGRETYGVPITSLHEIVRVPDITAVPDAPDYLEGVITLRGKIVSVMDLRKRFGEPNLGRRARGQAGGADRGFSLRGVKDSIRRGGACPRGFPGGRIELRDRTGEGWGTPGRPTRHEQAARAGQPAGQKRERREESKDGSSTWGGSKLNPAMI